MSSDGTADEGATNQWGELLTGDGKKRHEGFIITDASTIPTALGVNPLATITALAERAVMHASLRMGAKIDYETPNGLYSMSIPSDRSC